MRMGRFSSLTRQRLLSATHTDALFANQSQSILDDLVALLGQSSPGIAWTQNAVICDTKGFAKSSKNRSWRMSATWGNSEKIYSLRVLPPVTRFGHRAAFLRRVAVSSV